MIQHVFWDWNGTLADDAALLHRAVNTALAAIGHPPVSEQHLRARFARPLSALYESLTDRRYQDRWPAWQTAFVEASAPRTGPILADDALAAVRRWHAEGRTQSLLSSWPEASLLAQVGATPLPAYLDGVHGARRSEEAKADMLREELRQRGLDPELAVLIGDTKDDAEAARSAGTAVIICDAHAFAPIDSADLRSGQQHHADSLCAAVEIALAL